MGHALLIGVPELFGQMDSIEEWVARWGFLGVLLIVAGDGVFPALPGETAIVAAAVLAAGGTGNLFLVAAAGMLGAMLGDSTAYWIGRLGAGPIQRTLIRFIGRERFEMADGMVARNARPLVIGGRFLPGLRIAINMACGAGHLSYRRFITYESIGAFIWSTHAALLGYFAGIAFASQAWLAFVISIGVTVIVGLLIARRERRMQRKFRARAVEGTTGEAFTSCGDATTHEPSTGCDLPDTRQEPADSQENTETRS